MTLINDTTYNTVTRYISVGGGKNRFKKQIEKKNWCSRTNFNTGKRFEFTDSLDISLKYKNGGLKTT